MNIIIIVVETLTAVTHKQAEDSEVVGECERFKESSEADRLRLDLFEREKRDISNGRLLRGPNVERKRRSGGVRLKRRAADRRKRLA